MKTSYKLMLFTSALTSWLATDSVAGTRVDLPKPVMDEDYYENGNPTEEKVELGRMLFFDKVLSGNKNISCSTCHHPKLGTADGVALALGEGPRGLGPDRKTGRTKLESVHERVPRNAPALFNLGAREFTHLFHDGRVSVDTNDYYHGGFITPAKWKLPEGLDNPLAAQALFPVTSGTEMAGQQGENSIADAAALNNAAGPGGVWEQLAQRLSSIPAYVEKFQIAYPNLVEHADDITFVMAANAMAAFEADAFRSDTSRFDHYLRGDTSALTSQEVRGMNHFYGKANCVQCHSGAFQSDQAFHAIGMPQIGPGKGDGQDSSYFLSSGQAGLVEDFGRGRVTWNAKDNYKFRTPSLRNVELTGPYGHDGAYTSLEDVVQHHLNVSQALETYTLPGGALPFLNEVLELVIGADQLEHENMSASRREGFLMRDTWVQHTPALRNNLSVANELPSIELAQEEVSELVAFLKSLTDPRATDLSYLIPEQVPSGLPVED